MKLNFQTEGIWNSL